MRFILFKEEYAPGLSLQNVIKTRVWDFTLALEM